MLSLLIDAYEYQRYETKDRKNRIYAFFDDIIASLPEDIRSNVSKENIKMLLDSKYKGDPFVSRYTLTLLNVDENIKESFLKTGPYVIYVK
jgi:hypothetical protein